MIDNACHRKNFSLAKLKTILDYTFPYYIYSRSLWYMVIAKNGFTTVKH
jgi:hypothetical protein